MLSSRFPLGRPLKEVESATFLFLCFLSKLQFADFACSSRFEMADGPLLLKNGIWKYIASHCSSLLFPCLLFFSELTVTFEKFFVTVMFIYATDMILVFFFKILLLRCPLRSLSNLLFFSPSLWILAIDLLCFILCDSDFWQVFLSGFKF